MDNHLLLPLFWFVRISNILVFITITHFYVIVISQV